MVQRTSGGKRGDSVPHSESGELARRRLSVHTAVANVPAQRLSHVGQELVELPAGAFRNNLDASVREIADEPVHFVAAGDGDGSIPKSGRQTWTMYRSRSGKTWPKKA